MHGFKLAVLGRNAAISSLCNVHLYGLVLRLWDMIRLLLYGNLVTA